MGHGHRVRSRRVRGVGYRDNIEKAAKLTSEEGPSGPRFVKYRPQTVVERSYTGDLVRRRNCGARWLKLCCHQTACSPAISHEDGLARLKFGEATAAECLHVHEYVRRFRTAREKAKSA